MEDKRLLLCGVCCIDIVNYVQRYPEEDTDNVGVDQMITLGGNATNSGTILGQLNNKTDLFMAIPTHNTLFNNLAKKAGLNLSKCVSRETEDVPVSTVICNYELGTRTILHYNGDLPEPSAEEFKDKFKDFDDYGIVHFEAKSGRQYDQVVEMMDYIAEKRSFNTTPLISVEIEVRVPDRWVSEFVKKADIVFISKDYAQWREWTGMYEVLRQMQTLYDCTNTTLICPWGEKGALGKNTRTNHTVEVPAYPPDQVVDTLAAGDTFIASALHFINLSYDLETVLHSASKVAGRKCGQHGLINMNLKEIL
ncbi:unnamed protein product [Bursaphelenchus okinawaensis]|uniref:Carbohydrate kinase PfkB domain-containing protein n=1 Tax=Bursaphelenchus okinawaensis TaxID=465554 RepID=A0A811LK13_9BILA|nr:unnamed protein product [Bursaphelenchus okinawaensis]CAG9123897.1 unnamed protein product [Bursaphelenchus okinawaensis]